MGKVSIVDKACSLVGPLFVLIVVIKRSSTYRSEWAFGRWGMPQSLVAPDGAHHPNGKLIDPVTRLFVDAGLEPEFYLLLLGVVAACFGYTWHLYRQIERRRRQHLRATLTLEALYRARREGRCH